MKNLNSELQPKFESAVVAYLLAITVAAMFSPVILLIFDALEIWWRNGFEYSPAMFQFVEWQYPLRFYIFVAVAVWLLAFFSQIIPFILCIAVARSNKISHWIYFVSCGVLMASVPFYMVIAVLNYGFDYQNLWSHFLLRYTRVLPNLFVGGAIAGAVCWLYLRHREMR